MDIELDWKPSREELNRINQKILRQFVFAASKAINDVALGFQAVQRAHQERVFTIREKTFFKFAVKINRGDFAKINKLEARVHINTAVRRTKGFGAATRPDIWRRMQDEKTRRPKSGNKSLAIPQEDVKRTTRGLIRKGEFPDKVEDRGRSFRVDFKGGGAGVFERIGRRQKAFTKGVEAKAGSKIPLGNDPNVRFLYYLAPRATLHPKFQFYFNARTVWKNNFVDAYRNRLQQALATVK